MSEQTLDAHLERCEQRPPEKTVEIEKSYIEYLEGRDKFLSALEQAGVDNWGGYSCAFEILEANDET